MKRFKDWLMKKWPTISGVVFGIMFVVAVAYFVLLPVVGLLSYAALWSVTLVVLGLWVGLRLMDGGAPSRRLSRPLQVERVARRFGRKLTRPLVVSVRQKTPQVVDSTGYLADFRWRRSPESRILWG